jgi:hypothetical protein
MAVININVQATLQWHATETPRGRWIAECKPLGVALEADSLDELRSVINEATDLLFRDLFEDAEFDRFLKDRGWTASAPPPPTLTEDVRFHVPMELVAAVENDSARRAH